MGVCERAGLGKPAVPGERFHGGGDVARSLEEYVRK